MPYGNKSRALVNKYSKDCASFLISKGVKLIVVACNTASSLALPQLEKEQQTPIIGVIHPMLEALSKIRKRKEILVIGTYGTIHSQIYQSLIKHRFPNSNVRGRACPLLVPLIEEGLTDHPILDQTLEKYLKNSQTKKLDALILACTHYPLIKDTIRKFCDPTAEILDSAKTCAKNAKDFLISHSLMNNSRSMGKSTFFVSDDPCKFAKQAALFTKSPLQKAKKISL